MSKKILILILISFVVGCTTPGMIMKSWVGHTENELYRKWGSPSKVIDNGRAGKIAIYMPDSSISVTKSKYVNASQPVEYIGPRNNEYKKTKLFYISPMGNIYAWKWE